MDTNSTTWMKRRIARRNMKAIRLSRQKRKSAGGRGKVRARKGVTDRSSNYESDVREPLLLDRVRERVAAALATRLDRRSGRS